MSERQSGAEILARIQPRLRTIRLQLCLQPDLLEDWKAADAELAQYVNGDRERGTQRLAAAGGRTKELAEQVVAIEEAIEAASPWFTVQAMPKDEFQLLKERYAPRKNDQLDNYLGYNREAVADAAVRPCVIDPVFDDESWDEFVSVLGPGQWRTLRDTVDEANGVVADLPKSRLAGLVLHKRADTSESPESGTPHPGSSTGGPRKKSTSTSTRKARTPATPS